MECAENRGEDEGARPRLVVRMVKLTRSDDIDTKRRGRLNLNFKPRRLPPHRSSPAERGGQFILEKPRLMFIIKARMEKLLRPTPPATHSR